MAYLMISLIQREILAFVDSWNSHRIRKQKGVVLPEGTPNHKYNFREDYGLENCGTFHFNTG